MTQLREIYQCNICGNVVEIIKEGAPALVCCEQKMEKLEAKTQDVGLEKHVPVIEELEKGVKVKVGSVEHPMEEKHYIKFIELLTNERVCRIELKPGQKPEAVFGASRQNIIEAREYCTLHGLWKNV